MASVVLYQPPLDIRRLFCVVFARCFAMQNIYIKDVRHVTLPNKKGPIQKCMGPLKAPPARLELATSRLTADCSTN